MKNLSVGVIGTILFFVILYFLPASVDLIIASMFAISLVRDAIKKKAS